MRKFNKIFSVENLYYIFFILSASLYLLEFYSLKSSQAVVIKIIAIIKAIHLLFSLALVLDFICFVLSRLIKSIKLLEEKWFLVYNILLLASFFTGMFIPWFDLHSEIMAFYTKNHSVSYFWHFFHGHAILGIASMIYIFNLRKQKIKHTYFFQLNG